MVHRSTVARICVLSLAYLVASSSPASAQLTSGIAGLVRDASGAVLPGVTVEAASEVLIEKVRTVATDGEGRYRIVDLRPGSYTVTFSLTGFSTVKRDGVELVGGFTATVNADLRVGALEETVTVSGASPIVDTQNVVAQSVVSAELLSSLPTSNKALITMVNLVPGMTGTADVGGASGIFTTNQNGSFRQHGKTGTKILYDGMNALNMNAGGTSYVINSNTVEETTLQTGGNSAESVAAGAMINMIPKEGGNSFKGSIDSFYTNSHLQSNNLTDELQARGLTTVNKVLHLYDFNVALSGALRKDKLWFFIAPRAGGSQLQVPGVYFNATLGAPLYTPDLNRPAYRQERLWSQAERLTWQASPKNKVNVFADTQGLYIYGRGEFTSPEAGNAYDLWPNGLYQVTWSSTRTSRLLLEGGFSWMNGPSPFKCSRCDGGSMGFMAVSPTNISTTNLSTNFIYNAKPSYSSTWDNTRFVERFSASYVTGSHSIKTGIQVEEGISNQSVAVQQDVTYGFLGTAPNRITEFATPYLQKERLLPDLGLYAQDQWAIKRLTLNYGLRFNYFYGYVPAQDVPAGRFVGARSFAKVSGVPSWKDLNPRVGAAYDLFGTGRTALKVSLGRYNNMTSTNTQRANNPISTSVNSVTRTWTDNGNYVPDCDLLNPLANSNGGDTCTQISNLNFGSPTITTTYSPDVLRGWGVRPYLWDFAAEVQQQITSRLSMNAGYYRNWAGNFIAADNQAVTPADYTTYCITAPIDPRLPNGGGYPVCGMYDIVPEKFGVGNSVVSSFSKYAAPGSKVTCATAANATDTPCGQSDFFNLSLHTRLGKGIQLGGGIDTGHTVMDNCFVVDTPQQLLNCHVVTPFKALTQIKVFGSYPLPGAFVVSGNFQNTPGPAIAANYTATNAQILPSLQRNLGQCRGAATCTGSVSGIPLIHPMTQFEDRRTQVDLRLSKLFKMGQRELLANLDVYNVMNASAILAVNNTYGPSWLVPIAPGSGTEPIMVGRLIEFGGQFRF